MSIEARIEYVTTDDGVSLACTKFGSGPALIYQFANPYTSHFERELAFSPAAHTYEAVAQVATVVRYDPRNTGLSTRGVEEVSVERQVRDLDVIREHFQFESVALMFPFTWARIAVEYAAAHPERITALVLPQPRLYPEEGVFRQRFTDLLQAARHLGPEVYASIRSLLSVGLEAHEYAAWLTQYMIDAADFDDLLRGEAAIGQHDASAAAAKVGAPTLLMHRRFPRYTFGTASAELVREHRASITRLSAAIPRAQSSMFEGSSIWYSGDEAMTARMVEFLTQVFAAASPRERDRVEPAARGLRTVLFTDIVGHTEMMQRLGDTRGRDVLRDHERITRETLKRHGGAEVKTMGDGFMASFGSVTSAMQCAIALQRAFAVHTESMPEPLHVRVGLNAGEPIEEDGDLFGSTVILASRICAQAGPGEILIPEPLRHLLSGKNYVYADRGDTILRGFEDPIRLYAVRWSD